VSSSRERNDRQRPSGKPFSKGPKGPPDKAGKPPVKGRGPERDSSRPAFAKAPGKPTPRPAPKAFAAPERERITSDRTRGRPHQARAKADSGTDWLWGWHAVEAALANPARESFKRLLVSPTRAHDMEAKAGKAGVRIEMMEGADIARLLPAGAVHQGVALLAEPLDGVDLNSLIEGPSGVILMLDQLTDPQNVGAIFRSAAAFGARGVVLQDRNAPALTGALAKAAAGAVDAIPHARVVNLSRALELLAEGGWRAVGLDGSAALTLEEALDERPTVLVMGSEGDGLRRLVAEHCEVLAKIPMPGGFESLNVSNAAAVALYEAVRKQR
jgi:23S rRNA (guanosine2251-2'-O)-methyltransferase